jgi:hypothetical protein
MRRLTEDEIQHEGLRFDAWEASLFRWLWDGDKPVRFFHSPRCKEKWEEREAASQNHSVMNIEKLNLPVPAKRWKEQRCSRIVRSTGTHYFEGHKNRCGRMARFKLDGVPLCTQHAGEMALRHLMKLQDT